MAAASSYLMICLPLLAETPAPPTSAPEAPNLPVRTEDEPKEGGSSWVPIAGYNPTYKFFFGGGFFYNQPSYQFGIHGVLTFEKVYQVMQHWNHRISQNFSYGWSFEYSKGFEPFYGDGGDTQVADRIRIWGDKVLFKPRLGYHIDPFQEVGVFTDLRVRGEDYVDEGPPGRRFPNETTLGTGVFYRIDKRDNRDNPTAGFALGTSVTYVPTSLTTVKGLDDFWQLEGDFAVYQETFSNLIVAFKLAAGVTFGTPTYLFKYRLGGTDWLRGYQENRFRGKKYYLQTTELRLAVWRFLEPVGFIAFGDATDDRFTQAKMAYGIGVRLGLPPDFVSKVRVDFGIGRDESGIFIDFGHTF